MEIAEKKTGKTLILGLGNELRGDDAVGLLVVRELRRCLAQRDGGQRDDVERDDAQGSDLVFLEASVGGLALLDLVRGYQNLILVDAIRTEGGRPGGIHRLTGDGLPASRSPWSAHQMGLRTVLDAGRVCGCPVPGRVVVYAVEVADVHRWRQDCSQEVQDAVGKVVDRILKEELAVIQTGFVNRPEAENQPEAVNRPESASQPDSNDEGGGVS